MMKQRMLLLIADKQNIVEKLELLRDQNQGRVIGDLKEKQLLQIIESILKYRQSVKVEKENVDLNLAKWSQVSQKMKTYFEKTENEVIDLYRFFQKQEQELEEYRDQHAEYKGLPSDVSVAKVRLAQAHENLIKKREQFESILNQ